MSITEVFHFKTPRLGFSFLPKVSLEIIQCRFFQSDFHLSSYRMTVEIRPFYLAPNQFLRQFHKNCFSLFEFFETEFSLFSVYQFSRPIISLMVYVKVQKQPPELFFKKAFLKISRNSQKNTFARVFFLKKKQLQASACNFIKQNFVTLIKQKATYFIFT